VDACASHFLTVQVQVMATFLEDGGNEFEIHSLTSGFDPRATAMHCMRAGPGASVLEYSGTRHPVLAHAIDARLKSHRSQ
jgi:hypothetical protein